MRIFVIPDIHGRFDLLQGLWNILLNHHKLYLKKDKVIFLGDYVDRGLQSFEVLEFVCLLNEKHPKNVIALAGNHEYLMLDYYAGNDKWGLWKINGGAATINSFTFKGFDKPPEYLINWLKKLPLQHKEKGFFFSHAPVPAEQYRRVMNLGQEFTREELIWTCPIGDEGEYARVHDNGVIGVCGHIHALRHNIFEPRFYDHYIFADAGCGCHRKAPLCAINVNTREVIYNV